MKDSESSVVVEGSVKTVEAEVPSTESVEKSVGVEAILEEIVRHRVDHEAPWLSDKPPPEWWEGNREEWRELVETAREGRRPEALSWIAESVDLGWTLRERLVDRLDPGSKEVAGGRVRRPAPSLVSEGLVGRAIQLKNQLGQRHLYDNLEPALQVNLENAATRTQHELQAAVGAAERILAAAQREQQAKQQVQASKTLYRFFADCGEGRAYKSGTEAWLSPQEVEALQEWKRGVESGRGTLSSRGYKTWPAYEVAAVVE